MNNHINKIRLIVDMVVFVSIFSLIGKKLLYFEHSFTFLLFFLPILLINLLDFYFLVKSLFSTPKKTDHSFSTLVISLTGTILPTFSSFVVTPVESSSLLFQISRIIGIFLALLPYPFLVIALFDLKERVTVIPEAHGLVTSGIYAYSRHPLYAGYILWFISQVFLFPILSVFLFSILETLFLVLRAKKEEALLTEVFPEYKDYKKQVGWYPFFSFKRA